VATGFTLLGFLPAVVVHATLNNEDIRASWLTRLISLSAYGLSSFISFTHFYSALFNKTAPSEIGLQALTFGFAAILLILLALTKRQPNRKRAVWVVALVVFTVSALHLSQHEEGDLPWFIEAISNQASLPLALAI
ncbi:MAG: hypothetical protein JNN15_16045, partial [Blastocatellia bacterium]|nr:hypothetical protein [Blastocatellia bacterium]